jgi:hypothetical protein
MVMGRNEQIELLALPKGVCNVVIPIPDDNALN